MKTCNHRMISVYGYREGASFEKGDSVERIGERCLHCGAEVSEAKK